MKIGLFHCPRVLSVPNVLSVPRFVHDPIPKKSYHVLCNIRPTLKFGYHFYYNLNCFFYYFRWIIAGGITAIAIYIIVILIFKHVFKIDLFGSSKKRISRSRSLSKADVESTNTKRRRNTLRSTPEDEDDVH